MQAYLVPMVVDHGIQRWHIRVVVDLKAECAVGQNFLITRPLSSAQIHLIAHSASLARDRVILPAAATAAISSGESY